MTARASLSSIETLVSELSLSRPDSSSSNDLLDASPPPTPSSRRRTESNSALVPLMPSAATTTRRLNSNASLEGPLERTHKITDTASASTSPENPIATPQSTASPTAYDWQQQSINLCMHIYTRGFIDGIGSDITVSVPAWNKQYKLHRLILDQNPYFSTLLNGNFREASSGTVTLHFDKTNSYLTPESFEFVLARLYGKPNDPDINHNNVRQILATCSYLQLEQLCDQCYHFIARDLQEANVVDYLIFADQYVLQGSNKILEAVLTFLCREAWYMDRHAIAKIPVEWLQRLIESDAFWVPSEYDRYKFATQIISMKRLMYIDQQKAKKRSRSSTLENMELNKSIAEYSRGRRQSGLADQPSIDIMQNPDYPDLQNEEHEIIYHEIFSTAIIYTHMSFDQLDKIQKDRDDLTGLRYAPDNVLKDALWQQIELRSRIESACERETDLGLTTSAMDDPMNEKAGLRYAIPSDDTTTSTGESALSQAIGQKSEATAAKSVSSKLLPSETFMKTYSNYPPFRFSVEFNDVAALKPNVKVYSKNIFYAGSIWNMYIQKHKSQRKGPLLGIYLHRQSIPNTSTSHSGIGAIHEQTSSNDHGSPRNRTDSISAAASYSDRRKCVRTWFKIFCPARGPNHALTLFQSCPDEFTVSQSWGWKSTSLYSDRQAVDENQGSSEAEMTRHAAGLQTPTALRFSVVMGHVFGRKHASSASWDLAASPNEGPVQSKSTRTPTGSTLAPPPVNPIPSVSTHSPLRNPFSRHHHQPRRRSLDDPTVMVNPHSRSSSPTRKQELPYPRGGRQIGADPPQPLSRSNSGERKAQDNTDTGSHAPHKKRHLFGRFGKKKSHSNLTPMMTGSPNSSSASIPLFSSGTSTPTLIPSSTRKRSDGSASDMHHSNISTTSNYTAGDDQYFTPQWGHHFYAIPAKRYQTPYNKKRSDKNEAASLKDGKDTELDQNFDSMEGIVNTEYHSNEGSQTTLHPDSIFSSVYNSDTEAWMPPDSWAVQPAPTGSTRFPGTVTPVDAFEKEAEDDEGFSAVDHEKWEHSRKNYCIRIFRPDGTFTTLQVPLNTQASELVTKLAGKFFLPDISKYGLRMRRHKLERILAPNERPLQIQKQLLEQIGYTDQDRVEDVGREDNSYLVRFTFGPIVAPTLQEEDLDFGNYQHVDLQACNLPAVPIFLYRHAARIESLDVSKNLLIELPIDFVQMCTSLRQLRLANNEYAVMPPSVRYIRSLEQLNISGNRLRDLQHAQLDQLENLTSLTAFNNYLDCLPQYFGNFNHLTSLNISNNSFTTFPDVICSITTLVELDISFNKITDFPPEIGSLVNLVRLLAIANQLTGQLPPNFRNLESLKELDIRQNLITDLEVLTYLPSLEILFVDYNAVSIVNSEFKNLRQLKMCKNHLTQFNLSPSPANVSEDLHGIPRQLEGFPGMTGTLLTELNISSCKLSSLAEDMFANLTAIETLVLDNNTLNSLPSSIGELRMLSRLSAQNNLLSSLPVEIAKLGQLKTLDVQKNNLQTLPKEIWLCSALQNLNCSSNLLETFPEPYSAPGVALHVALGPQAQAVVTPTVMANAASDVQQNTALGTNAGQGMVPTQNTNMPLMMNASPSGSQQQLHDITGIASSSEYPPRTDSLPGKTSSETRPNSLTGVQAGTPHAPPNFNPPSFFASPRNHPPPLSLSLRKLFLGDNRLTDDIWSPLSLFLELRTLNLCFNDLYDIPTEGLCHQHLYELYLSGNQLASLPADDIEKLSYLRVLAVNGNKLQTLPAEIGKLRKLLVLDVGSNVLKYNIANLEYDWNWNWNLGLKYLNLSGNKRLEIKVHKDLSDFSSLSRLRVLGLMDVTIFVSVPDETHDRRTRTSPSEVNSMAYGIADWLGPNDHLATWDLVMPRFRMRDDECLFGLYDGRKTTKSGCKITKYLNDAFTIHFTSELKKLKDDDTVVAALRRTFLSLEKELGSTVVDDKSLGASAVVCYISGTKLYVANVGDALAVISRNNGQAYEITQKHIPLNPSEISRIRAAGGYVSNSDALNGELNVSRSFGHFRLIPVVNANPYISTIDLTEEDEFVIMASKGLWERMSYQSAVDIARTEREDLMLAAQKLRDFAITYGADDNIMVMVIGVGDMFDKRDKRYRVQRGGTLPVGRAGSSTDAGILLEDGTTPGPLALMGKSKRRGKEEGPGDSTLARLEREVPPPINQVALVFTDIKNSTLLWETQPEGMRSAIKIHDSVMRRTLRSVGGYEVKTEGDAFMVCFQNITSALLWCFTVQLQLLEADWPAGILDTEDGREIEKDGVVIYKGLSVRMGIHWGSPVFERNPITNRMDYFGPVVNKAGRICTAADGGQICVSSDVIAALRSFPGVLEGDDSPSTDPALNGEDLTSVMAGSGRSISKDIVQLRRLGFHVMELGERRLKGLETPEILSMVYPKQLAARMELDKMELLSHGGVVPPPNITPPPMIATPAISTAEMVNSPFGEHLPETATTSVAFTKLLESNHIQSLVRLALRLEGVASGNIMQPTFHNSLLEVNNTVGASDEQILHLIENLVTRIENAASMMYLQKMGRFTSVLEKLGEAIEVDPSHILRALQMYADVIGASDPPKGKKENNE